MRKTPFLSGFVAIILVITLLLTGCSVRQKPTEATDSADNTISVAIYPYIPDMQLFQTVLSKQWQEIEPDVQLSFVDWDCYVTPEPGQIDVMMYDAMFTSYLAEGGFIQPVSKEVLQDAEEILPFALEGAYHDGELYGVPYLVCSYFLIHRSDDPQLAEVQNVGQLFDVIAARKAQDADTGLLMNYFSDYPYHYLDAMIDESGIYTLYEEAPPRSPLDAQAYERICQMKQMLAVEPENSGNSELGSFYRGALFNEGYGCAYYGYSEDISFMDDILDDITIRTISFSEKKNIQLFYADIASMGAHVTDPARKELCIRLMNLIGSEEFLQELCFGTDDVQYMLPARQDVYALAQEKYPIYGHLYELVMDEENRILRFGKDIHMYLATAYEDLA